MNKEDLTASLWIGSLALCLSILALVFSLAAVFAPRNAEAASITVYPTITNAHGGTAIARDMSVCITIDGAQECVSDNAVPVFEVASSSSYQVGVTAVPGYSYSLGNNCSGIAGPDARTCNVDYADGAPIPKPAAPTPVQAAIVPAVTLPASVVPDVSVGGATPAVDPIPGETATTSVNADVAAQIASLQAQIIELYKILIALLAQRLAVIK